MEVEILEKRHGGARKGSGMKPGQKIKKTIEKEIARAAYHQMVLENLTPLFHKQLWLAMGQTYVYRKKKHGTGASMRIEHVLLTEPHEIADALDTIANSDFQEEENGFVYIVTKPPENRAIDSMLDRSIGKPKQDVDLTTAGDKIVFNVISYGNTDTVPLHSEAVSTQITESTG